MCVLYVYIYTQNQNSGVDVLRLLIRIYVEGISRIF